MLPKPCHLADIAYLGAQHRIVGWVNLIGFEDLWSINADVVANIG